MNQQSTCQSCDNQTIPVSNQIAHAQRLVAPRREDVSKRLVAQRREDVSKRLVAVRREDVSKRHLMVGGGSQLVTPPADYVSVKHMPATYPTDDGQGIKTTCYQQQCQTPQVASTVNPCYVKSRHYIQPWTVADSYYLDLTQPFIGGRPVHQASNVNAIPRTLLYDTGNLMNRSFHCQQPCWSSQCI